MVINPRFFPMKGFCQVPVLVFLLSGRGKAGDCPGTANPERAFP